MSAKRFMREHHGLRAVVRMPTYADLEPWCWLCPIYPGLMQPLAYYVGRQSRLYCPRPPVSTTVKRLHAERGYDLVVGRYLLYAVTAGLHRHPHSILDADDVDTEVQSSRLRDPGLPAWRRFVMRRHIRQLSAIVPENLARFSALWVSNPEDRALSGLERAQVLVNLPFQAATGEAPPASSSPPSCKTAVVVSSWHYKPNVDGLNLFLESCWPGIRRACPQARLRVVGFKMSDSMRERLATVPGVEPVGFVEDLSRVYAESAFAIAPVFSGGGTNIKVLEALWHGRTCLVTGAAHRGYREALPAGECLEVGDDLDRLAMGAVRLYNEPAYRDRLAAAGHAALRAHYSFTSFCHVVERTVEEVLVHGT